ncbi:MAG: RHS repeat-associated core domain-containing protein [Candidatus Binatia bacterium]
MLLLSFATAAGAGMQTTTTTYAHNADGAVVAVTTVVDGGTPRTTYFTWDNYLPDETTPTSGTVSAADGNLIAVGDAPGLTAQLSYDVRDRLVSCSPGDGPSASYAYDPASLMASSTLASQDTLRFHYDTSAPALMVNIAHSSTGLVSSFLGPVHYLSDGREQVLLNPRKDTAGVYDADAQTLASYAYDPYGARTDAPAPIGDDYDLAANPFQYGGEYRDPSCGAYYLRARWYLAGHQTFLSRDAGDPLHRYNYTAGNPIGRVDPSGLRSVEAGARHFLRSVDASGNGAGGAAARFFLGAELGIAQIVANPSGYWHRLEHDTGGIDIFLAAGLATELGTSGWGPLPELPGSYRESFVGRHLIDSIIGVGQSVASGYGGHRFDWAAVGQGVEYTAGGMFEGRELLGLGYKPFSLNADDVTRQATTHFASGDRDTDVLVYRVRGPLFRIRGVNAPQFTSPLLEAVNLGVYHESLVGVLRQWDSSIQGLANANYSISAEPMQVLSENRLSHQRLISRGAGVGVGRSQSAAFVGDYTKGADTFLKAAGKETGDDFLTRNRQVAIKRDTGGYPADPYRLLGNNCQTFAGRIRGNLGF